MSERQKSQGVRSRESIRDQVYILHYMDSIKLNTVSGSWSKDRATTFGTWINRKKVERRPDPLHLNSPASNLPSRKSPAPLFPAKNRPGSPRRLCHYATNGRVHEFRRNVPEILTVIPYLLTNGASGNRFGVPEFSEFSAKCAT